MSIPKISKEYQDTIRAFLQFNFTGSNCGQTFFRRIDKVVGHTFVSATKIDTPYLPTTKLSMRDVEQLSRKEIDKSVQVKFKTFHGFTKTHSVRNEPECVNNLPIFFHSKNFSQMDLTHDMTFNFTNDKRLTSTVTPMEGDLVFIFLSNETINDIISGKGETKYPNADMWFIASEQFLRAYTLILYEWHDTFDLLMNIPLDTPREIKEDSLRDKIFSGNRLMTNSWAKYILANEAQGIVTSQIDSIERFWSLRTEYASKRWIDVWGALVLISRYGELPFLSNIPNNKSGPQRVSWDIPKNLIPQLFKKALNLENIADALEEDTPYNFTHSPFLESNHKKPVYKDVTQNIEVQFFDAETDDSWASKIRKSLVIS